MHGRQVPPPLPRGRWAIRASDTTWYWARPEAPAVGKARQPVARARYEPPTLEPLGRWNALTLQISVPIPP